MYEKLSQMIDTECIVREGGSEVTTELKPLLTETNLIKWERSGTVIFRMVDIFVFFVL